MSKLSSIGDRIVAKQRTHENKANEYDARLDVLDAAEPAAFTAGDVAVAEREQDLKQLESDMRMMSNFPPADEVAVECVRAISLVPAPPARQLRRRLRSFRGKRF